MREMEGVHGSEMIIIEFVVYDILKTFHLKYMEEMLWFPKIDF